MDSNPYAPPSAPLPGPTTPTAGPLWNPGAAASWSIVFTPIFGALLHAKNWETLGDPQKAAMSRTWAWVAGVGLVVAIPLTFFLPDRTGDALGRIVSFGILLGWYLTLGKKQLELVKERYGKDYPRRGFGKPIAVALAIAMTVMAVLFYGVFFLFTRTD
jgi:hypothetical protein